MKTLLILHCKIAAAVTDKSWRSVLSTNHNSCTQLPKPGVTESEQQQNPEYTATLHTVSQKNYTTQPPMILTVVVQSNSSIFGTNITMQICH